MIPVYLNMDFLKPHIILTQVDRLKTRHEEPNSFCDRFLTLPSQVKKLEQLPEEDRKAAVKYIDALMSKSRRVNGSPS